MIQWLLPALLGYLLGCSNMAFYLARLRGVDIRDAGSGNAGASNAMVLMGWGAGVLTAVHDIGKSVLAVVLARLLFPEAPYAGLVAGAASVIGHMFPVFLHFRGGKGFASYFGMILSVSWKYALILAAVCVVVTLVTDYIVMATMTTVVTFPVYAAVALGWTAFAIAGVTSLIVISKHRENFRRLADGTEIGLRRANSGRERLKK